jgi:hypothetical protein
MIDDFTPLGLLADRLRAAPSADPEIFLSIVRVCTRVATLRQAGKADHLDRLLANGAWTDAGLALLAMELPGWTVRRLVYEDGEWICSLSRQPNLPLAIDDTVDAHHPALPLAVLGALVEVRARTAAHAPSPSSVPQAKPALGHTQCCDNFA